MFILQRPPCRVNVQTTYIFQLFFERSAKKPRGAGRSPGRDDSITVQL